MAELVARGAPGRRRRLLDHPHDPAPGQGRRAGRGHHRHGRGADRHRHGPRRGRLRRVRDRHRHVRPRRASSPGWRAIARRDRAAGHLRLPAGRPAPRALARGCSSWPTRPTAEGARIVPQVAGRPACVLFGLRRRPRTRSCSTPTWQALADLPLAERRRPELREPEVRAAMLERAAAELSGIAGVPGAAFHKMFPLGDPPEYEPAPERSVAGRSPPARGARPRRSPTT